MSKLQPWFRMYADLLNDPKVQRLSGDHFKLWVNLLCLAKKNDGALPSAEDIAWAFTRSGDAGPIIEALEVLVGAGLFDREDGKLVPHNWSGRQFVSDGRSYWDRTKETKKGQSGKIGRPIFDGHRQKQAGPEQRRKKEESVERTQTKTTSPRVERLQGTSEGRKREDSDSPSVAPVRTEIPATDPGKAKPHVRLDVPSAASISNEEWLRHYSAFKRVGSIAWPAELGPTPKDLGCVMPKVVREMWSRQHGPPSNGADPPLAAVPEISIESTDEQTFLRVT